MRASCCEPCDRTAREPDRLAECPARTSDPHEHLWGGTEQRIIGYGAFEQVRRSGAAVDWFVVGLAVQKSHLSVYVSAVEDGQYLVKRFADRLGKVKVGSANVTFTRLSDVELPVLLEMAERARDLTG